MVADGMKVYIVAGEPSGDLLAAGLMRALRRAASGVRFRGVGGEEMRAASDGRFESLFDISEISVMGIFEVLPRLPLILKRLGQTVKDVEEFRPDVLVTVDSWGFVSALLSRLRKRWNGEARFPVVHYVAPQVWAWKKGRAKNVARLVDRLMTLLPDEGKYFEKYGLQCDFVGHPVVERIAQADLDPDAFRAANDIPVGATVVSVLPGSRRSEIKRLLPILRDAVGRVAEGVETRESAVGGRVEKVRAPQIFVVVPTVAGVEEDVRRGFERGHDGHMHGQGFGHGGRRLDPGDRFGHGRNTHGQEQGASDLPVRVVTGTANRYNAFAVSDIALAKSGTVSLELSAVGVPHLIAYKFNALSNFAARMLVKVRFANLVNIIAGREIIPEFVLDNCRADLIAGCAQELLSSPEKAGNQVAEARRVMQRLRQPDILPSDAAARVVLDAAGGQARGRRQAGHRAAAKIKKQAASIDRRTARRSNTINTTKPGE